MLLTLIADHAIKGNVDNNTAEEAMAKTKTWSGQHLQKTYPDLSVTGVWKIMGEDDGLGTSPTIANVRGSLRNAIDYAVNHPKFYTWGSGGSIERIVIIDLPL